ncbi:hypothetical protein N656DRAFT_281700 [Canariomyces notabilis]|uniref:Uncharacterized protein n=1 Tax=Canariomyces notabilis TaxID=2074819 RepID=A0AAN6YWQ5_9PEZI|nr:hypothetical protein N656DRAFT_281700 [Canariomyces arenarius]
MNPPAHRSIWACRYSRPCGTPRVTGNRVHMHAAFTGISIHVCISSLSPNHHASAPQPIPRVPTGPGSDKSPQTVRRMTTGPLWGLQCIVLDHQAPPERPKSWRVQGSEAFDFLVHLSLSTSFRTLVSTSVAGQLIRELWLALSLPCTMHGSTGTCRVGTKLN